ncbi:unnamed protein product [Spirodela intermedia]|uniref:Uncharacterized protein n=1 Tax=Spirodela intermedia TaxID=51605 RepID=A0A7I8LJ24_SPIIN|nr:unnamed protein product [Spirodela intermedia]
MTERTYPLFFRRWKGGRSSRCA